MRFFCKQWPVHHRLICEKRQRKAIQHPDLSTKTHRSCDSLHVTEIMALLTHPQPSFNNANAPVTKAELKAEFGKFEERLDKKLDKLLSEQANVILEAVGETMEKKLDEKFDPVITKLDGILKGVEALQQENTVGAEQLRRHEDQLQKHEARIAKLETASA